MITKKEVLDNLEQVKAVIKDILIRDSLVKYEN
jgi:hypothetical protein